MRYISWSAVFALAITPFLITSAMAGGKAIACYQQATVPAVYKTVQERVLVRAASNRVVKKAAVYGYQKRRVLVQPERVSYRKTPAVYQTRQRHVLVKQASIGWEYRMIKGRKTLCKVKHPPVYQAVSERVKVQAASKVAVRHPAIYSMVKEKVMLQPASSHVIRQPAVYKTVNRRVQVQPARTVWQPVKIKGCRY
ncbi:hypothetical protein [Roseibium album]|uniref:hypothetical protein n=1 Tax=Roseibium album TaxID=311410 RepID=UPI0018C9DACB|nr:hypothetical protein [Roseibium album]MBG6209622.1 hypothetical protein [Labrenzia sp. EL_126]